MLWTSICIKVLNLCFVCLYRAEQQGETNPHSENIHSDMLYVPEGDITNIN